MPAQNDPQTQSKFAISGARNQQFWGSRGVPGGPGGGPGCSWGVPGGLEGSRGAPGGLPGGSRGRPGGLLAASREAPGGLGESLGGVLGGPGRPLGPSWGGPGGSWGGPGRSWRGLGRGPGGSWAFLGPQDPPRRQILDRFGADLGSNLGPGTPENNCFSCVFLLMSVGSREYVNINKN